MKTLVGSGHIDLCKMIMDNNRGCHIKTRPEDYSWPEIRLMANQIEWVNREGTVETSYKLAISLYR